MHERGASWNSVWLLFTLPLLLQLASSDFVVKQITHPGHYPIRHGEEIDLDFEYAGQETDANVGNDGIDFLFVRLDSTYGQPFTQIPPTDLSRNTSLTPQMVMPSGEMFPWYSTDGLSVQLTPSNTPECPLKTSLCSSDEIYLKFDFLYVEDVDKTNGQRSTLNLVSVEPYLRVDLEPISGTVRAVWANGIVSEARLQDGISDWTTVEIFVKPDTQEIVLLLSVQENEQTPVSKSPQITNPQGLFNLPASVEIRVGPFNHTRKILTSLSVVSEKTGSLKRSRRNTYSYERGADVSALNFENTNGFVKYNFGNRIKLSRMGADVGSEEVALDFTIKEGVTSGLLWFAKGTTSKSFIIIKDSKLRYKYIAYDETLGARRTLTEEIIVNETLQAGKTHRLRLNRDKHLLTLSLGTQRKFEKIITGKVPLIPDDGVIYIGGSDNAAISTDGEITRNFDGSVTAAKIVLEGSTNSSLNMLDLIRDPNWTGDVSRKGDVKYEYHMPFDPSRRSRLPNPSPLMPTASTQDLAGITLQTHPIPVTFMGTQSSVVRFDTWDFSVYSSFEIEFLTFEPSGVLFFVGPDREHTDFVCVEIFDGNVYFSYAIGNHYRHIQMNPPGTKANTWTPQRVYVKRTPQHRFIVKYNGQEVNADQGTKLHQAEFSSYTYFGSIDQPSRFPWIVWSRENFAGCINFIRVNDDKFLDPASRMNQHTDLSRGIQFGICKSPDLRCNREICGGGQCLQRSYPFFEPVNFACDCSSSDRTFREGVEDIRRSEACHRDSPVVDFDGETAVMVDFERQMNTLTTHVDDINLQFKTKNPDGPLFVAVSTAVKQYFLVELKNGRIRVTTNMNKASKPPRDAEFVLQGGSRLNDDVWHTLRIRRRAQFITISVDNANEESVSLDVNIPEGVFNNIAQQIYVGSLMPRNYASPPYGNMAGFLPEGAKFVGEMRNFYWNQYDFFGTRRLINHYTTDILTPRLELPVFPTWPREPLYSITCTSKLTWGTIHVPIKADEAGDMWMLEFKTKYDGVLTHAIDKNTGSHFTLIILKGRLHIVYSIGRVTGVHGIINSPISVTDGIWHRVIFGLDRKKGRIVIKVDDSTPETYGHRLQHSTLTSITFHFGGVGDSWRDIWKIIRTYVPTFLPIGYENGPPAITGCLGGFSTRADHFLVDLLKKFDARLESYPPGEIIRGYCKDLVRCTPEYCLNGGVCQRVSDTVLRCNCTSTGFTGHDCGIRVTTCPPNYCHNGGACTLVGSLPVCSCLGTGYYGDLCEIPICTYDYCKNGGICSVVNNEAVCDCRRTGYTGGTCNIPMCRPGYCMNGGVCTAVDGNPVCDCYNTGYGGQLCEQPICRPGYCLNGGQCIVQNGQPTCDCRNVNFVGVHCEQSICRPGYCANGGVCLVHNGQPQCDCRDTGYSGPQCTQSICPVGYCLNGGRCTVQNGQPICNCEGTDYRGDRCGHPICTSDYCSGRGVCKVEQGRAVCECQKGYWGPQCRLEVCPSDFCHHGGSCYPGSDNRPHCRCPDNYEGDQCEIPKICPQGYCYHGGQCTMQNGLPSCDCANTDYQGLRCQTPKKCPPGYCQNGGVCTVQNGRYVCNCLNSGFQGPMCNDPVACPSNYCHGGICTVLPGGRYACNCWKTGLSGANCDGDVNGIYVDYEKIGFMVYDLNPPSKTTEDNVTVGFKTYSQSGTILDFVTTTGAHWSIKVRNGYLVVDTNGQEFMYPNAVDDGAFHVVSVERKGNRMLVTFDNDQIVNFPMSGITEKADGSITYTTFYVGANMKKEDIFRGAIGGLYWNGRYPIDEAKGGLQVVNGEVIYVLLPSFILPGKKPTPVCPPDYCFNGGICNVENYELNCDCRLTGWQGSRCETPTRGLLPSVSGNGAYVIISVVPPKRTNLDRMRVAFQTYSTDGPIGRFTSPDGRFYEIYTKGQQVFVSNNKDEIRLISAPYQQCDDGKMHVIALLRNGSRFEWSVDGHRTVYNDNSLVDSNGALITSEIILGADRNFTHSFNGVLGAFDWNGGLLITDNGALSSISKVMIVPGRGLGDREDVKIVLMPHLLPLPVVTTLLPPVPFPPVMPPDGVHGGAIIGGGDLYVPGVGYGAGASGVFAGAGPLLLQAGGAGFFGLINPWLAGILVCLLPLISALIWACWRCKPGCCPCCLGGVGGKGPGGKFHDTVDRISAGLWASPTADKGLHATNGNAAQAGNFHPVPPGGAAIFATGGQTKSGYVLGQDRQVDITDRYDMTTMDQHLEAVPNVYTTDDLKVDCCVLTQNSRCVVTGSASSPPQVWDMQTGEPFKVMNGDEMGCSDLHLAVQDTLLVGQVLEDFQSTESTRMHRLQLWNFVTGEQLEMPAEILCSASCVSNAGEHIVAARLTPQGQSILVWDLIGNQLTREIPYSPINPNAQVAYINITPEDRLVVAGVNNPGTDQACFMVFDLAAEARGVVQPKYITFEAKAEATEILNNEEAVTGTRKGELIIWNLLTTTPVRQITINATLEGDTLVTTFPPHDGMVHDIVLSEDRGFLVTASQDHRVRVWTMPEERLLHTLEGHADDVLSVVVSCDSEMVVSGSWDGSIRVWRMKDGSQMCIFTSNIEVLQVKLSRDKRAIVGLGERNGHRKLIMMQIVRSRTCAPAVYTRLASPGGGGGGGGGLSPTLLQAPLPEDLLP